MKKRVSRTVEQKTNSLGFPKPSEFIEMTGVHALEASDRAIFNVLYQLAHDSANIMDPAAEWTVSLATLRQAISRHESTDRIRDSLERLRSINATVRYLDDDGQPRVVLTHLFDFFDLPEREMNSQQILRFGLPRKVLPVIRVSGRWGRVKAEIVCAMTSKYAIALYEMVQLRSGLEKCIETVSVDRLRDLVGVPPGQYARVDNLMSKVIHPAVLQVNGLSNMSVMIEGRRKHARAGVDRFDIAWWRKPPEELARVSRERNRSKVGRMARLKSAFEVGAPKMTELV